MRQFLAALLLCFAGVVPSAQAALVSLRATGSVIEVSDGLGLLPFPAEVGDLFTIQYTFESDTADSQSGPNYGTYSFPLAVTVTVAGNQYLFVPGSGSTSIVNDVNVLGGWSRDSYQLNATEPSLLNGLTAGAFVYLVSDSRTSPNPALSTDALPIAGFDTTPFLSSRLMRFGISSYVNGSREGSSIVYGTLNSIETVAPVPLPAAAWLLLSGIGGLGFIGRRKAA